MPRPAHLSLILLLGLALAACADGPDLGAQTGSTGPAPQILPLDQLIAEARGGQITAATGASVAARAARLRARAAAMQGPVLDPQTRARLAAAIANGAGI